MQKLMISRAPFSSTELVSLLIDMNSHQFKECVAKTADVLVACDVGEVVTAMNRNNCVHINGDLLDLTKREELDIVMNHIDRLQSSGFSNELAGLCFQLLQTR